MSNVTALSASDLHETSANISLPRGNGLKPLILDMTKVYEVESRIGEIAHSNPMTFPVLVSEFNLSYIQISKMVAAVQLEKAQVETMLNQAKSVALLDTVELTLANKKIKSTADTREAALHLDPQVQEFTQRLNMLEAVHTLLKDKAKGIEMAYHAAKKVAELNARIPDGSIKGGLSAGE